MKVIAITHKVMLKIQKVFGHVMPSFYDFTSQFPSLMVHILDIISSVISSLSFLSGSGVYYMLCVNPYRV